MDLNGVKNLKYTSISNVQRKLMKNNAYDDSKGDDFDTVNGKLLKKKSIELIKAEDTSEAAPNLNALPKTPQIFSDQNTKVLSDQKEDSWKRAILFMNQKEKPSKID